MLAVHVVQQIPVLPEHDAIIIDEAEISGDTFECISHGSRLVWQMARTEDLAADADMCRTVCQCEAIVPTHSCREIPQPWIPLLRIQVDLFQTSKFVINLSFRAES